MARPNRKYVLDDGRATGAGAYASPESVFEYAPGDSPAAVLQNTIYRRFAEMDALASQPDFANDPEPRIEAVITFVSRWGGVSLFVAALTGVLVAIF